MMANERYKILRAGYLAAYHGLGSGIIYLLAPSGRGKTTTRDMIRRDCPKCKVVPSATEAGLYEFFSKNFSDAMFIIDDKTEWMKDDFGNAIAYGKMIGTGKLKRLRMSKFTVEDTEISVCCVTVVSLNPDQANSVAYKLKETGFLERALKLRINHTKEQYDYIKKEYTAHRWNRNNLPYLDVPEGFYKSPENYGLDEETETWINDCFRSEASDTVKLIAMVTSKEGFETLKPALLSGVTETEFREDIRFKAGV